MKSVPHKWNYPWVPLNLVFLLMYGIVVAPLQACPATIFLENSVFKNADVRRSSLHLYQLRVSNSSPIGQWQSVPLQIDPMSTEGKLLFYNNLDWRRDKLQETDRLSFPSHNWGVFWDQRQIAPPCSAKSSLELSSRADRNAYLYLFQCFDEINEPNANVKRVVLKNAVTSDLYSYQHNTDNHLLFENIDIKRPDGSVLSLATDADQFIRADVKNFFTLNFNSQDIEAYIDHERVGAMGMVSELSFFLKILFFKIELKLAPEIHFFPDSIYMPMVVYLPIDAKKHLHPGSGLYYSWRTSPDVTWDMEHSSVPQYDGKANLVDYSAMIRRGLSVCQNDFCEYTLIGTIKNEGSFVILFRIHKALVATGFFPQFYADAEKATQQTGWTMTSKIPHGRSGLFFDSSGLPKGGHNWDFWIRFGSSWQEVMDQCHTQVNVVRLIPLTQTKVTHE